MKPRVILNCAASADGKIALPNRQKLDLSNSVKKVRKLYRRYLFTKQNIKKGQKFNINNIAFKRSDKNINGLEPKEFFSFNNKKSKINLKKNLIIKKNFIAKNNS